MSTVTLLERFVDKVLAKIDKIDFLCVVITFLHES